MSDRSLDAGTSAAVVQPHVTHFPLIQMDFDSGVSRISGADFDVEWPIGSGIFFRTVRGLGSMEAITETNESVEGIKFSLAGVPVERVIEAQQEKYQGRPCTVLWAFIDDAGIHVDPAVWKGRLDIPIIDPGKDTCVLSVTAEHTMVDWQRPRPLLFNSVSQKRYHPTDTVFDGIELSRQTEKIIFSKAARTRT